MPISGGALPRRPARGEALGGKIQNRNLAPTDILIKDNKSPPKVSIGFS